MYDMPCKPYWVFALAKHSPWHRLGLTVLCVGGALLVWVLLAYLPVSYSLAGYEKRIAHERARVAEIEKARADIVRFQQQRTQSQAVAGTVGAARSPVELLLHSVAESGLQFSTFTQSTQQSSENKKNFFHLEVQGALTGIKQLFSTFAQSATPILCTSVRLSGTQSGNFVLTAQFSE